ncbi:aminopeptidase N, peptidase M1 family [Psychroflexus torquis ATCC 700755]|uniref:Aminopeptidase N, peptidase M1 family n=1 Tax=Psychroflexus torquis (strain ATCC 700755 / CIP 106069 / ACAM 623) TaxID=313595 RepID=K4IMG9_PSYTT|nr:M1 family metallopeptidase [Psychroflexus torquis]AFU70271.1 aminopeptidase N, peptidase M1 family [Psychroflexus torquis ATCC 700755]
MKRIYIFLFIFCFPLTMHSQIVNADQELFSRADTLRGGLRAERTSFDVLSYTLDIKVNPEKRYIQGFNEIEFEVRASTKRIQLDLFQNMKIDSVIFESKSLNYEREFNAVFINFDKSLQKNSVQNLKFYYSGYPKVAKNAPWDGGFVFSKDSNDKPFIGVAVQGTGASLWYPNKDHQSDEPESVDIKVSVPNGLMNVSNGRLIAETAIEDGYTQWHWRVEHPINNYNITLNIADYVHFKDQYNELSLDYYVLKENLDKAKQQFQQVHPMMDCFYEKFGDYPFQKDGFKLVETPYLGMEHQSAVAYGNGYQNGYLGTDLSKTGIGLKWDFIIIHESAHEWFGNSVSAADIADMWIHESFTAYAESVFVECEFGKKEAIRYLYGLRDIIANDRPIIGKYGVNHEGSGDMYYKGANMLNTLRSVIDNDEKWWSLLKEFHKTFKYQTIQANDVINFYNSRTELNLKPIFDQYLKYSSIPELQLKFDKNKTLYLRWKTDVENFKMPIDFQNVEEGQLSRAVIDNNWKKIEVELEDLGDLAINKYGYYITIIQVK